MPLYDFKVLEEIAWLALVAAAVAVLQIVVTADPGTIIDWRAWAIALGAAGARAAAAAVLARLRPPSSSGSGG